jgi:hypothetical protein
MLTELLMIEWLGFSCDRGGRAKRQGGRWLAARCGEAHARPSA